jgi:hypothetical protein
LPFCSGAGGSAGGLLQSQRPRLVIIQIEKAVVLPRLTR